MILFSVVIVWLCGRLAAQPFYLAEGLRPSGRCGSSDDAWSSQLLRLTPPSSVLCHIILNGAPRVRTSELVSEDERAVISPFFFFDTVK
ncbi:hypothetical protein [Dipodfec virus UA23Rod_1363]|uniref:Uncharacterized protein n=1 Tax=Dipodfec virus UA23Rod_1363 TaxID=2929331 RepID=A0A976N230_9VIRU|nr:hypothetical protein [Dipodfec virus UA23Rod_1363]